ncbi:MAG TPA: GNAT family N-acetyltransferase, partial [Terriglobales bacterium]|nr:GNAT family N-acetyltransferase [Terriglobales bacterium]
VHSPELTLFQTFRWNHIAARHFHAREAPYFVVAEDDNGAAIIPAVVRSEPRDIGLAGEALFDYRDYLAAGDSRALMRGWQHLTSLGLPLSLTAIRRAQGPIWNRLPKRFFSRSPMLKREEMAESQFAESHSRAFSRFRKLQRFGLELKTYKGDSGAVREIYERRARQSAPGDLFHDRTRIEFMVAICREEGARCEVYTLEHGGTLAAALVTFRDNDYRRFYTTYYDRAWARYSPGISLLFEVARRSLQEDLSFDLMTGEQGFKKRLATSAQDLFEVKATASQLAECLAPIAAIEHAA